MAVCFLHGAGGGDPSIGNLLPAYAAATAAATAAALPCLRFTHRSSSLDRRVAVCQAVLARAASLHSALSAVRRWILMGHSMGCRVACCVASGADPPQQQHEIAARILASYPLHPPGRPHESRGALLAALPPHVPVLLVRGARDPFSLPQQLWDEAVRSMPDAAAVRQHSVPGGNHSLQVPGGADRCDEALQAACAAVQQFVADVVAAQEGASSDGGGGGGRRGGKRRAAPLQRHRLCSDSGGKRRVGGARTQ